MLKIRSLFLIFISLSVMLSSAYAAQLTNYLGTGQNPKLVLELSANAQKWQSFTIDYRQSGNIPNDWSTWNIKDETHYYGTITLHSDNTLVTWDNYVTDQSGFYLEGIHLSQVTAGVYTLSVDKIHQNIGSGPFPNTPLAKPATYSDGTPMKLSVNNNHIINNHGKTILLKGVVRPSLEWNSQGQYLNPHDLEIMHTKWNANVIRLDLNQNFWFASADKSTAGSYKQIIDAIIYYATQNHMAVILDLHWTENGHQNPMANKESIRFWKEVAGEYKNFGTVIFELFNEPFGVEPNVWLKGNANYAGYQELYDVVRSVGADNICIVNGLDYGYDLSFVNNDFRVTGTNIVYGSHPYNAKGSDGGFEKNFQGVIGKYPLIFTEFGSNNSADYPNQYEPIYTRILAATNQMQISYTAFAWWVEPGNPAFPTIIADWDGTPVNGGKLIKNDMQVFPGTTL